VIRGLVWIDTIERKERKRIDERGKMANIKLKWNQIRVTSWKPEQQLKFFFFFFSFQNVFLLLWIHWFHQGWKTKKKQNRKRRNHFSIARRRRRRRCRHRRRWSIGRLFPKLPSFLSFKCQSEGSQTRQSDPGGFVCKRIVPAWPEEAEEFNFRHKRNPFSPLASIFISYINLILFFYYLFVVFLFNFLFILFIIEYSSCVSSEGAGEGRRGRDFWLVLIVWNFWLLLIFCCCCWWWFQYF